MFRFEFDKDDLLQLGTWIRSLEPSSQENDVGVALVKTLGQHTSIQFATRGQHFGKKWQNISRYTEVIREQRGIPVLNPPLHGKGWLRLATGDHLSGMPWNNSSWKSEDHTRYAASPSDGPTAVYATVLGSHATVRMVGAKAGHMFTDTSKTFVGYGEYKRGAYGRRGGTTANRYGFGFVPARPFWGINNQLLDDATTRGVNRIFLNWYNRSPNGHRTTRFMPSITEWVS